MYCMIEYADHALCFLLHLKSKFMTSSTDLSASKFLVR